jgi:translation initiation factor 2 beta subunit (eIF-2beta)/eIF-5
VINDLVLQFRTLTPADRWQALDAIIDEQKKQSQSWDALIQEWEVERIDYQTQIDAYRDALESLKADMRRIEKATSQLKASPDAWILPGDGAAVIYWTQSESDTAHSLAEQYGRPLIPLVRLDRVGVP